MTMIELRRGSSARLALTVTLAAFTLAACSGRRQDDEVAVVARAISAVPPGAQTPMTDLAQAAETATGALSAVTNALLTQSDALPAADDAAYAAAAWANAAAKAIEETDMREYDRSVAGQVEGAAAAAHAGAAALVDVASNATEADDGANRQEFLLDSPQIGIHIPPMTWAVQYKYSADGVLMALASDIYDPADYIRDYAEFLALRKPKEK